MASKTAAKSLAKSDGLDDLLDSEDTTDDFFNDEDPTTEPAPASVTTVANAVGQKRKTQDAQVVDTSIADKRTPTAPTSRLNQVQSASVSTPPLPVRNGSQPSAASTAVTAIPSNSRNNGTIFALVSKLADIKVLAAHAESQFTPVSQYIFHTSNTKALELFKKYTIKGRGALAPRGDADSAIRLMDFFTIGPMRVNGNIVENFGILGKKSVAKPGEPAFSKRSYIMWLGPTVDPQDEESKVLTLPLVPSMPISPTNQRHVKMPSYSSISNETIESLKTLVRHLFGCVFDGPVDGTEDVRSACLLEVLNEMAQENPGSRVVTGGSENTDSLDGVDNEPELLLASGESLTSSDPNVRKRVRERFICKGAAPIYSDNPNEAVRKNTPWYDPSAKILQVKRNVTRKMTSDEREQAMKMKPPILDTWINQPPPTMEDFEEPKKSSECIKYINSCGYMYDKLRFVDQSGKPFVVQQTQTESHDDEEQKDDGDENFQELKEGEQTANVDESLGFVYKRAPRSPRVLTIGSIIMARIRLRLWVGKGYGVHFDFGPPVIMVERRVSEFKRDNYDVTNMFGSDISVDEYASMLPTTDYGHMASGALFGNQE